MKSTINIMKNNGVNDLKKQISDAADNFKSLDNKTIIIDQVIDLIKSKTNNAVIDEVKKFFLKIQEKESVAKLIPFLYSEDPKQRNLAIEILEGIGDLDSDKILDMFKEKDDDVRIFAAGIIRKLTKTDKVINRLEELFNDSNKNVVIQAIESAGELAASKLSKDIIDRIEKDDDLYLPGIIALGKIGNTEAMEFLKNELDKGDNNTARCLIINTLGESKNMDVLKELNDLNNNNRYNECECDIHRSILKISINLKKYEYITPRLILNLIEEEMDNIYSILSEIIDKYNNNEKNELIKRLCGLLDNYDIEAKDKTESIFYILIDKYPDTVKEGMERYYKTLDIDKKEYFKESILNLQEEFVKQLCFFQQK